MTDDTMPEGAVRALDLSMSNKHEHPDIKTDGTLYLVKINGGWFSGRFSRQWYGLNFDNWGTSGRQFDAPGWNCSDWEAVLEIDPEALAALRPSVPDEASARIAELEAALRPLLRRYVGLAESGDAGFWKPDEEPEVIAARAALDKQDAPDR